MTTLGEKIKELREAQGLTLEKLSDLSGVDIGTISALENRRSKKSQYAPQLADALGLNLAEMMELSKDPNFRVHAAEPPPPPYLVDRMAEDPDSWPFRTISRAQWGQLPDSWRTQAEVYITGLISARMLK